MGREVKISSQPWKQKALRAFQRASNWVWGVYAACDGERKRWDLSNW